MTQTCVIQGSCPLTDQGVIRVRGADATSFLHGQLTRDLAGMHGTSAAPAGYCSPKGRLLASFIALRRREDEWLLVCSADLLAATLKRLSMFVLRSKVALDDASQEWPLVGSVAPLPAGDGPEAAPWAVQAHPQHLVLRLPPAAGHARGLILGAAPEPEGTLPLAAWNGLEARSGMARIVAATSDHFVPQMVNLDLVGGVSFHKGCYPGQEVVARSQYRGSIKRRGFVAAASAPVAPGTEIVVAGEAGDPAGEVVNAGCLGQQHWAFVEIKTALAGQALAAGPARLTLQPPPYELPSNDA